MTIKQGKRPVHRCLWFWFIISLISYSLFVWILIFCFGLHKGQEIKLHPEDGGYTFHFDGYFSKWNWPLFVIYWPIIYGLLYLTWDAFDYAWSGLKQNGVLRKIDGSLVGEEQVAIIKRALQQFRSWAIVFAVLGALFLVFLDTGDVRNLFKWYGQNELPRMYTNHVLLARTEITNRVKLNDKQVLVYSIIQANDPVSTSNPAVTGKLSGKLEFDFTLASYFPKYGTNRVLDNGALISRQENVNLNRLIYGQEIIIAALSLLALFQIFIQCFVFWFLKNIFAQQGLTIQLDPESPLCEFGLESWNHALNNVYWVFSAALLIPIISWNSQPESTRDTGQSILMIMVPLLIASPMLITIIGRQQYLPAAARKLVESAKGDQRKEKIDLYAAQRLWPLDKNWASKLGIVIAFVLLSLLLGVNLWKLASGGGGD